MTDDDLRRDCAAAGIHAEWRDVLDTTHPVSPDTLRAILHALGELPDRRMAPLVTADQWRQVEFQGVPGPYRLTLEDGQVIEGHANQATPGMVWLPQVDHPGYHRLELGDRKITLAVAPPRCWTVADAAPGRRCWGLTTQLYALSRAGDGGIGDFAALRQFLASAATAGAEAVAISPVHAQFSADPGRFSPYAPSSRGMLNVMHAAADMESTDDQGVGWGGEATSLEDNTLIDWAASGTFRLAALRRRFAAMGTREAAAFAAWRVASGQETERHARFEALHESHYRGGARLWHWRDWPADQQDPSSIGVDRFAAENAASVDFHAYAQFVADRGLQSAQATARDAGMAIGLIADIAVGVDPGGSDAWRRPGELLSGLTIGAPPDIFNPAGQNWGVTTYSPHGLAARGFGAFIEMLRASLRHAGGMRIDHAMGLARLWVVPAGAGSGEGAYLTYPLTDLLRLVRLESQRNQAIVLGEDLGTLPDGFRWQLEQAGLSGMRVLWFERDGNRFLPPREWSADAAAMTSTHDLPTVAGWWRGRDLEWRTLLSGADIGADREIRAADRTELANAFRNAGALPADAPEPAPDDIEAAADAAAIQIGRSACALALLPIEDALALVEQPNIPGTIDEHPNWRRRLPGPAASLLDATGVRQRLLGMAKARDEAPG